MSKPDTEDPIRRILELSDEAEMINISNQSWKYEFSKIFQELRLIKSGLKNDKDLHDQIDKGVIRYFGPKCKSVRKSQPKPDPIESTLGEGTFAEFIKALGNFSNKNKTIDNEPWEDYIF